MGADEGIEEHILPLDTDVGPAATGDNERFMMGVGMEASLGAASESLDGAYSGTGSDLAPYPTILIV